MDNPESGTSLNNLYLQTGLGPIDFLSTIDGVGNFEEVRKNAEKITLFDRKVCVINIHDLLKAKEKLGREKDLMAAKELRAILERKNQND